MGNVARLSGHKAIEAAELHGVELHKYADPTEGARDGLTVAEAREIAAVDPSLVWADAFEACGHLWRWTELSEGSYSLLCLDPVYSQGVDSDGNPYDDCDVSQWPSDAELSAIVGVPVKFFDGGDHPDYPEGIFHAVEEAP